MVSDRAFIFNMCIPRGKIFSLIPRLRSSVKVKVKYNIFRKLVITGGISVPQTWLVVIMLNPLSPNPKL